MPISRSERPPAGKIILTYDEYVDLPNDGNRYEILDGDLFVTPAPSPQHQLVSRNLQFTIHQFAREHGLGEIFAAPIDLILAATTVAQPDLVFVSQERRAIVTNRGIEGAPDLVVEILSSTTTKTDRTTKARLYARYGIRHYWILDPESRNLEAYELSGNAYHLASTLTGESTFSPSLFPGLTIPLADVWAS